jgi:hypothetical protein
MRSREDEIEDAWSALTIMAGYTPDRIAEGRRVYFEVFASGFTQLGVGSPEWIDDLRRRVEQG